jgi:hypothetical protein
MTRTRLACLPVAAGLPAALALVLLAPAPDPGQERAGPVPEAPVFFEKQVLTDKYYCDGVTVGDINRDGKPDVVAGPFWYEGPDFRTRHEFYPAEALDPAAAPSNSMFSYVYDFNGDGWPDILVLGRVHLHEAFWYENPRGEPGPWKKHFAFHRILGESPPFMDVDGDGRPELVAHWEGRWGFIRPDWKDPTRPWTFHPITAQGNWPQFYHGTGIGDVNGDGRPDLLLNDGWWEQPPAAAGEAEWVAHPFRFAEKGGAQMFAYDVDGDGRNDVIAALDAHGWGLAWFQQVKERGEVTFRKHVIMGDRSDMGKYGVAFSQPHALALADLDGDGLKDIVVGKRRWAHGPTGDVEPNEAPVLYWFRLVREEGKEPTFRPYLIDDNSGVGVQITVADVDGDGRPDILTASKLGVFLFHNRKGPRPSEPQPEAASPARPRLLVLTDIGGDPDDQQSLIRLLLYANEFDIEGLIATSSGTPGELKERVTRPDLIRQTVEAYGEVRDNLARHADGYPTARSLLDRVKSGNPARGRDAIGEGHDTEGSRWIIAVVDRNDPRPVNVTIWGGQTDLAQALWRVRHDRGADGLAKFVAQMRVHDISDQDRLAGWLGEEFPGLFYVLSKAPDGRDMREAAHRGMYLGGDESLVSRDWMETHIRRGHGPLGALYPPKTWTAPNPSGAMKEGDTPSWFAFLPNGLSNPDHPEWGGWGGRFVRTRGRVYRDGQDSVGGLTDARATVWRWRPAFQADFQARLGWCTAGTFREANHNPVAVLNGDRSRGPVQLTAHAGETVRLSAEGSHDPDGDALGMRWFVYPEAGTYGGDIDLSAAEGRTTQFTAPRVAAPQTVHVILEVRDDGSPGLYAYRRAVITLEP